MTAALARKIAHVADGNMRPAARPTPLAVFIARAEAKALLWQAGELQLHDAVDALQASAIASGLIADIGQDEVQYILRDAFHAVRA